MQSRVGVLIRCYGATDYLPAILKNYSWVDKIVVMNYRFKTAEIIEDKTEEIARSFNHANLVFEKGEGLSQHDIFNRGMKLLNDCHTAFISDADEFISLTAMRDIVSKMESADYAIGSCRIVDYAFDYHHRFDNRHLNPTLVVVNPKLVNFVRIRIAHTKFPTITFDHKLYHFGFVLPKKTLDWKLRWESKEERLDIVKGITQTEIVLSEPPEPEIMELLP